MTPSMPTIICLCGSTRFSDAYKKAATYETINGHIVLTIHVDPKTDLPDYSRQDKASLRKSLDRLHLYQIALADELLVINQDDYIGPSTRRQIAHAAKLGKPIHYLFPHKETDPK